MALTVYWFDFICFGVVAASLLGALYLLWRDEFLGSRNESQRYCGDNNAVYSSLIAGRPESNDQRNGGFVRRTAGHVGWSQLWTSCWREVHPMWLLGLRFFSFVAMACFLTWDVLKWGAPVYIYYTEWTFTLTMIYFGLGTIISAYGCLIYYNKPFTAHSWGRSETRPNDMEESESTVTVTFKANNHVELIKLQNNYAEEEIPERAGFWGHFMQIIYQTCAGAVFLTDVVFWCVIVPFLSNGHLRLNLLMGCMHTLNLFFLLLDTTFNNLPFPWFRLAYFMLWSCIYVIFQWVIHACGFTRWPYPFLELSSKWAPLWYFCLAVMHIPCYGLYALIVKAKDSLCSKFFPRAFVRY